MKKLKYKEFVNYVNENGCYYKIIPGVEDTVVCFEGFNNFWIRRESIKSMYMIYDLVDNKSVSIECTGGWTELYLFYKDFMKAAKKNCVCKEDLNEYGFEVHIYDKKSENSEVDLYHAPYGRVKTVEVENVHIAVDKVKTTEAADFFENFYMDYYNAQDSCIRIWGENEFTPRALYSIFEDLRDCDDGIIIISHFDYQFQTTSYALLSIEDYEAGEKKFMIEFYIL